MSVSHFRKGRLALLAALLAAACCVPVAAAIIGGRLRADRNQTAIRQLIQLELAFNAAYDNQNGAFLQNLLSDDFLYTDSDGNVSGKAGYIAFVVDPNRTSSGGLSEMLIRVYGDSAVVVARWSGTETFEGVESTTSFRYMDVWVRRGGRWYVTASMDANLPE
jgi:hypothetical protein